MNVKKSDGNLWFIDKAVDLLLKIINLYIRFIKFLLELFDYLI
jgi:hypothetical protein